MTRALRIGSHWANLTIAAALGISFYWYFIDVAPPLVVSYQYPTTIEPGADSRPDIVPMPVIYRGAPAAFYQEYCLERKARGVVSVHFVNGTIHAVPDVSNLGDAGCFKRSWGIRIPRDLSAGEWVYQAKIEYAMNPLRTVTVDLPPVKFMLLDR